MLNTIGNTVSALLANQLRVSNAAANIANADSRNYVPQDVVQQQNATGGVTAHVEARTPSSVTTLNADGQIDDTPNVDLDQELVQSQLATYDFKANAFVLKTQQQLQKRVIDILA